MPAPDEKKNRKAVATKIDWEGGLSGALEYGLTVDDMPDGDTELRQAWQELMEVQAVWDEKASIVDKLLEQGNE